MDTFRHARASVKRYKGKIEDYLDIHQFLDSAKIAHGSIRHRAILHNTFGTFLVEKIFGVTRINSDNIEYSTRKIAEEHIIEDLQTSEIPSLDRWISKLPVEDWMYGKRTSKDKTIKLF